MKILSLFDGMSCGYLAMLKAEVPIDRYVAYEIDKYAVQTSKHNFPDIEHRGDVFDADFTEFQGFDFLVGGSPCTYWSIAQSPDKRETTASGMGWELFSQYVRALNEAKPKFFIYENNKSMSKEIRQSISVTFGFEPIMIDSALVSAQSRKRLYWVGKQNDGGYSKVDVELPKDKGILLKDILEGAGRFNRKIGFREAGDKSFAICASDWRGINRNQTQNAVYERVVPKSFSICLAINPSSDMQPRTIEPVGTTAEGKSYCLTSNYSSAQGNDYTAHTLNKATKSLCAEPVCVAQRGRYKDNSNETEQQFEVRGQKTNALTTVHKDNMIAEPVGTTKDGKSFAVTAYYSTGQNAPHTLNKHIGSMVAEPIGVTEDGKVHTLIAGYYKANLHPFATNATNRNQPRVAQPIRVGNMPTSKGKISDSQGNRVYSVNGKGVTQAANGGGLGAKTWLYAMPILKVKEATEKGYADIEIGDCFDYGMPNSKTRRGRLMKEKSNCLTTSNDFYQYFAYAVEFNEQGKPTKAVSLLDGKDYNVYEVQNGKIKIKDKQYPIKLGDGFYIIRKLTVRECMRLQTVPEWYQFPVSDTQAYKMLGNGWTVDVITHLIQSALIGNVEPEQIKLF